MIVAKVGLQGKEMPHAVASTFLAANPPFQGAVFREQTPDQHIPESGVAGRRTARCGTIGSEELTNS